MRELNPISGPIHILAGIQRVWSKLDIDIRRVARRLSSHKL